MQEQEQAEPLSKLVEEVKKDLVILIVTNLKANALAADEARRLAADLLKSLPAATEEDFPENLRKLAEKYKIVRPLYEKYAATTAEDQGESTPNVTGGKVTSKPLPPASPARITIGKDVTDGCLVKLAQSNRLQGTYIIGLKGTGKSTLIENLIVQDIEQGFGVCLLDPDGDLTKALLARIPEKRVGDVILLDLLDTEYPFGLNLFECAHPENIDFRKIMDEGKIFLVRLSGCVEEISNLVGTVIIGKLLDAAYSRQELPEEQRRQFNLYADEFQRFATEEFATLLSEAPKFGIATTIAHQTRSQLDQVNRAVALHSAIKIIFRVTSEDGEELAKELEHKQPEPKIIGQQAIRVPTVHPIGHLLRNGHPNKGLLPLIDYLSKAQAYLQKQPDQPYKTQEQIYAEYQETNLKKWHPELEREIERKVRDLHERLKKRAITNLENEKTNISNTLDALNTFYHTAMTDITAPLAILPEVYHTFYDLVCDKYMLSQPTGEKRGEYYEVVAILIDPTRVQKEAQKAAELCYTAFVKNSIWMLSRYMEPTQEQREGVWKDAVNHLTQMHKLVAVLHRSARILRNEPVLVESGQYKPIYENPRSYQEIENEIANTLANLPNRTAHVKTQTGEVTIATLAPSQGVTGATFDARLATVQEQTRKQYCKSSSEVEQEVSCRQEALVTFESIEGSS